MTKAIIKPRTENESLANNIKEINIIWPLFLCCQTWPRNLEARHVVTAVFLSVADLERVPAFFQATFPAKMGQPGT